MPAASRAVRSAGSRLNEWRQAAADFSIPPVPVTHTSVTCIDADGAEDELLVITVESSDRVHTNRRDEVFLRMGDETRRLSFDQRRELEFDKDRATSR